MSATAQNFKDAVAACREALRANTYLAPKDILNIIACLEANDGATLSSTIASLHTTASALNTDVLALHMDYGTQIAILSAFTGADMAATIVAAIATAKGVLDPEISAVFVDNSVIQPEVTTLVGASPVNVTIAAQTVADGLPFAGS